MRIHAHALKHGLSRDEVAYAWANLLESRQRLDDGEPRYWIGIGATRDGRFVEMIGFLDESYEWCVFHAMTPPTRKFLKELGLRG